MSFPWLGGERHRALMIVGFGLYVVWHPVLHTLLSPVVDVVMACVAVAVGAAALARAPVAGALPFTLLATFWVVLAALWPWWSAWDRQIVWQACVPGLVAHAVVSLALVALTAGRAGGLEAVRRLWLVVLLTTTPVGVWEAVTRRNIVPDPWFGPTGAPATVFHNPNNFAAVLLLGIGMCLLWLPELRSRRAQAALAGLILVDGYLLLRTNSRMANVMALGVAALGVTQWAHRLGHISRLRAWCVRHPREAAIAATGLVGWLIASFTVPDLFRFNVVYRILFPGDLQTSASDEYRLTLLRHGLEFWWGAPITGVGAGRFETLLRSEHPEVRVLPVHNAFLELLLEFGIVPAALLAGLLGVLVWRAVAFGRAGRDDPADTAPYRSSLVVVLIAVIYGAVIIDSALGWTPWWLMIATAVSIAWRLGASRRSSPIGPRGPNGGPRWQMRPGDPAAT